LYIDFHFENGTSQREAIKIDKRQQTLEFNLPAEPIWTNLDPHNILVGTIEQDTLGSKLAAQYDLATSYRDRVQAIDAITSTDQTSYLSTLTKALSDKHWSIRRKAIKNLGANAPGKVIDKIRELAINDPHSKVRAEAFLALTSTFSDKNIELAESAISKDQSYKVIGSALGLLAAQSPKNALPLIPELVNTKQSDILTAIGNIYVSEKDNTKASFFEENYLIIDGVQNFDFLSAYSVISQLEGGEQAFKSYDLLHKIGTDMGQPPYRRYASIDALNQIRDLYQEKAAFKNEEERKALNEVSDLLTEKIEDIKSKETHKQLIRFYSSY